MPGVYAALVHHPVVDRRGDVIAAAVTNLDLHDLGRLACTYGLAGVFIVTPLADQQEFVRRIVGHWTDGPGAAHHPDRPAALRRLETAPTVADAIAAVTAREGRRPLVSASGAREIPGAVGHADWRRRHGGAGPHLLLFGTAWGLAPEVFAAADIVLRPIPGVDGYNHLSVRCAAAILVDRLLGTPA